MKTLFLVDVSSLFFRAFYAIRPLTNKAGLPTNAIYGFLTMTMKLLKEKNPDYIAFCFDRPEPSFRKEIDPRYKANRSDMPEDLVPQIPYIRRLGEELGIACLDMKGFEADDIIGTLTSKSLGKNIDVVIVSGDKDFAQLIQPHVRMYDTMKEMYYDEEEVLKKWGVKPGKFIDFLAITGDTSDNIPGVKGIGPKGAQKLLEDFSSLEEIYEKLDQVKPDGIRKKLTEHKADALLSKQLVTIHTDVQVPYEVETLAIQTLDQNRLRATLEELDFHTLIPKVLGENSVLLGQFSDVKMPETRAYKAPERPLKVLHTQEILERELSFANARNWFSEVKRLWVMKVADRHYFSDGKQIITLSSGLKDLGEFLNTRDPIEWKGWGLKDCWHDLGLTDPIGLWDTEVAAYLIKSGPVESFFQAYSEHCGKELSELSRMSHIYFAQIELEEALKEELKKTKMEDIFERFDLPLVTVLYTMERKGITVDFKALKEQSRLLEQDLGELEKEIYKEAGQAFNILSPKQLAEILFEKLQLAKGKKTKTGYSTNVDILEKLAPKNPIAEHVLKFRELAKLKATYTDALPLLVDERTGRLHTRFIQTNTSTGRLSSINPNLQNIPIRTERGRMIRKAFVAPKGYQLVSADYSQIELRILAHITEDPGLVNAFKEDLDIHTATAAEVFGVPLDQVNSDMRRKAKAVNFGIAYGQGVFGLAESLRIGRDESKEIIQRYFERFPGVKNYMEDTIRVANENAYVETLFGRRRSIPEMKSSSQNLRKAGERAAINAPIQGTAADIVKLAMIELSHHFKNRILLQVHDELIFEIPDKEVEQWIPLIRKTMENCAELTVPLKVNVAYGPNWEEAHS